jgi:autotransporter-associated beta strand protein
VYDAVSVAAELLESRVLFAWIGATSGSANDAAHNYNNTANWSGGTINDSFSGVTFSASTTLYLSASRTTASTGLNLNYTGNVSLTLESSSTTAARTLTINGGIADSATGTSRTVTLGNASSVVNLSLNNATQTFNVASDQVVVLGAVASGGLTKSGAGTVTLSGSNTYASGTTLSAGKLNLNNASAIGTGTFTINGGTIDNTSTVGITLSTNNSQVWGGDFNYAGTTSLNLGTGAITLTGNRSVGASGAKPLTVGGAISDAGHGYSLTKTNGTFSAIILNGANTYSGTTTVSTGNLTLGNTNALQNSTVVINGNSNLHFSSGIGSFNVGGLSGPGNETLSADVTVAPVNLVVGGNGSTNTYSGVISGPGSVKINGGTETLSASNTFTGGMTVAAGKLNISNASAIGTGILTLTGGTFDNTTGSPLTLTNAEHWGGNFTFAGTNSLDLGTAAVSLTANTNVTVAASSITAGGTVSGAFSLTKAGSGTLALSGANTFNGGATVSTGTLLANNASGSATGTGSVAVSSGGTLGGTGTVTGAVTVASGGTLAPSAGSGGTSILNTGALVLSSGSNLDIDLNGNAPGTQYDEINVTGTASFSGSNLVLSGTRSAQDGAALNIVNTTGTISGTFSGLAPGGTVAFNGVTYTANYAGSGGDDFVLTANSPATTTTVSSSANPSTLGDSVTFTAAVSAIGGGTPTGSVTFMDGTTILDTVPVDGTDQAKLTISTLTLGLHSITASYGGDANFTGSVSSPVLQNVTPVLSWTLSSSLNPSPVGQTVDFTAVVSSTVTGTPTPTGTVTFIKDGTPWDTETLGSGQATFSTSTLPVGNYAITAVYGGDSSYAPSTSPIWHQDVVNAPATPTLVSTKALSATQVVVTWTEDGTSQPEGYQVRAAASGQPYTTVEAVYQNPDSGLITQSVVVDGLVPDTSYTFYVFAHNSQVSSLASNTSSCITAGRIGVTSVTGMSGTTYTVSPGSPAPDETVTYDWTAMGNGITHPLTGSGLTFTVPAGTNPLEISVRATTPGGGLDTETVYTAPPTIVLTGTGANNTFEVQYNAATQEYSFKGSVEDVPRVIAPGINLEVQGRGGSDTLQIDGGNVTLATDAGSDGTQLSTTVEGGADLHIATTQHLAALAINASATADMLQDGDHVLVLGSLTIAQSDSAWIGKLDLRDNDLIVHSNSGILSAITSQIKSGFNAGVGYWDGDGITSSSAANDGNFLTTLGSAEDSALGYSTFDGEAVTGTDVLVGFTYYGDANLDRIVDSSDYALIDNGFANHLTGWSNGDFNYDGVVDGLDYSLIDNVNTHQWPALASATAGSDYTLAVPSGLSSSTVWLIDWGDGTTQQVVGDGTTTPLTHNYSILSGVAQVSVTAFTGGTFGVGSTYVVPQRTLTIAPSSSITLPDASGSFGPSGTLTYPAGADVFTPPVGGTLNSGVPVISDFTRTANAGQSVVLTATNLDLSSTFWVYGETNSGNAQLVQAKLEAIDTSATHGGATIILPASLAANSAYMIWAQNSSGYSAPVIVNQPNITWADTNNAYAGGTVSLFGTNLADNNGLVPYSGKSWIYIQSTSGGLIKRVDAMAQAPATNGSGAKDVNPYKVDFTLPGDLTAGDYNAYVYNGHGGTYGWSNAFGFTVLSSDYELTTTPPDPNHPVENALEIAHDDLNESLYKYNGTRYIDSQVLQDVIDWVEMHVAGAFSPGQYAKLDIPAGEVDVTADTQTSLFYIPLGVGNGLILPAHIQLVGAGNSSDLSSGTVIKAVPNSGLTQLVDAFDGSPNSNLGVQDMQLIANGGLSSTNKGVIYFEHGGHEILVQNATIDGRNGAAANVAEALHGQIANAQFLNSTFIGLGLELDFPDDVIIDNCHFIGCGDSSAGGQILTHSGTQVSVTRCTDQGLVDDVANPDPHLDLDSSTRLFDGNTVGYSFYFGNNQTIHIHPPSGLNGGEQILLEPGDIDQNVAVFQNVLQGDGVETFVADSSGYAGDGKNITVDDNDIGGVLLGINVVFHPDSRINFESYNNNSIHNVVRGMWIHDGGFDVHDYLFRGLIFSDNSITDTHQALHGSIAIWTDGTQPVTSAFALGNLAQMFMNVFEGNTGTDTPVGVLSSSVTSDSSDLVDAIYYGNFFFSNGTAGSIGLSDTFSTIDANDKVLDGNNFQNFETDIFNG